MTVGVLEIFLVLFVVLLILGPSRIVDLGRALGRGVRDFKLEFGSKAAGNQRSAIGKEREADGGRKPTTSKAPDKEL
jgi:TatA/E family protein of Tat protein translocase